MAGAARALPDKNGLAAASPPVSPLPPTGRLYFQDNPLAYISSTYCDANGNCGDAYAPWWGITDEAGVNQPFGNMAPQVCAVKDSKGKYCVLGGPLQYTYYNATNGSTLSVPYGGTLSQLLAGSTVGGITPSPKNVIPGGYAVLMNQPNPVTSVLNSASGTTFGLQLPTSSSTLQYYSAYNKARVSPGALPINLDAAVSSVALCGTLAGQLFFGYLGDKFGRKAAYGLTLAIMVFCAAAQSMSFGTNSLAVIGTLCWWRFFLGFGVGGDYPLSATIMSEYSSRLSRGAFVSAVFAMQGVGILTAAAVTTIVSSCFNGYYPALPYPADDMAGNPALYYSLIKQSCPCQSDFIWRVVLGFGAIPAGATVYLRATFPETPRYTLHVQHNKAQLAADMSSVTNIELDATNTKVSKADHMTFLQFLKKHGKELLGTTMTWMLLDVAFYSQGLFQKQVFTQIGWLPPASAMNAMTETFRIARAQALIALGSTIPGYYFTVFTVDFMGRLKIQYMGFAMMTAFMAAIAGGYNHLLIPNTNDGAGLNNLQPAGRNGFVTMYALCFFFANWGPNATTFVIPAELFPTKWKSTGHGISAACGKAGAIVGAFGFLFASQPAKGELSWKFPCLNSATFPFTSYQWNFDSMSPNVANPLAPVDGPYEALTAYYQNLAVPGTFAQPLGNSGVYGKPPFKNSLGYGAIYVNSATVGTTAGAPGAAMTATQAAAALNAGSGSTTFVNGLYGTNYFVSYNPTTHGNGSYSAEYVNTNGQLLAYGPTTTLLWNFSAASPTSCPGNVGCPPTWITSDGVVNPSGYGFPQQYSNAFNVANFKTAQFLPANTSACLVKPNCPGGMIGTPAINNGIESYKCVCPIPAPVSGCFPFGIGVQGALGILAGTNFLGMIFTLLLPETNGKTLEELSGETKDDYDNEKEVATTV